MSNLARTLLVVAVIFALDRATKFWVVVHLDLANRLHIPVLDPWLNFAMAWNQGINFGLFDFGAAGRWILVGLALAICVALLLWTRGGGWAQAIGAGLIVGGALGNVWDRLRWGAVADFINMSCCGIRNPFAFNLADAAIFLGAGMLLLWSRPVGSTRDGARKGR
jgi:signal peptidase II